MSDMKKRLILLILIVLIGAAGYVLWPRIGYALRAGYNRLRYGVVTPRAPTDADGDGLDDWADLTLGARAYIGTHPVYDPGYYDGGYAPEGHGVCADVIWRALKAAGYDFKALLDQDISSHPGRYPLPNGMKDSNIDFRRVVNLEAYFRYNGLTVTGEWLDPNQWQPGDIVVYEGHIAVCSDRRNGQGLPYIIHHTGRGAFEEDALTDRPILGHYRWVAPQ